jgi:predicted Ser/Thr protein kinase
VPEISHDASVCVAAEEEGRYERMLCLGRGAWGVVYLARDRVIDRTVALKIIEFASALSPEVREEMVTRSGREARAAGALNHPNIVTIHDAGSADNDSAFFIVMEYVEGETLSRRLQNGPLHSRDAVRIGTEIADALEYAHRMGVIHRDVKPANILIRKDGVSKIADFGVARMESSELTLTGQWVGSPAYMSPEQAQGRPVDSRSDIFALGVVIYEMVTGVRPFKADTVAGLSYQIIHEDPAPPAVVNPGLDPLWDEVILRAMAKDPDRRHASAAALGSALVALEPDVGGTAPSPPWRPSGAGIDTGTLELQIQSMTAPAGRPAPSGVTRGRMAAAAAVILVPVGVIMGLHALEDIDLTPEPARMTVEFDEAPGGPAAADLSAATDGLESADTGALSTNLGGAAVRTATVVLNVEHGLESGRIELGVDGSPLWVQSIRPPREGRRLTAVARRLRGITAGVTEAEIEVPSGSQEISVSVITREGTWSQTTRHDLPTGGREILDVRIRNGRSMEMEMKWKR